MCIWKKQQQETMMQNQKKSFRGNYIGCDEVSGLAMPNWEYIAKAFDIKYFRLSELGIDSYEFKNLFNSDASVFFDVQVDPEQTYFPKIISKHIKDGSVISNPIHVMEPILSAEYVQKYFKYI
jgi:acetolactate synthase-1/2/3 large subunit